MSRTVRKQMLTMVDLLEKANRALKASLTKKRINEEGILQLLADCQETAITVGNALEELYGEGTESVAALEDYCEGLYQMTVALYDTEKRKEVLRDLTGQLLRIRKGISGEVPDRLEVVFLPYKASMWDSLESVWMAADADENCDAYVIPIPYYDKNPDGSFKEEHYEIDEYPDYVPVMNYDDYNFAGRMPDMIFIHNPYNDQNYVTSVHPFFYSNKLKEYTDMLVYIPYFVLSEINPENRAAVENIEHFCTVPAVFHADKVIVQSENIRRIYINTLMKYMEGGNEKAIRKYWEDKILGLGSPKVDKAVRTNQQKEGLDIPEEWKKLIRKPDGSSKKIILYNTGVDALLKQDMKMILKIRHVLKLFRQQQEEVTLLWRPHPLIQATIESMRPHLYKAYREIVDAYRQEGWGIYDDSSDMDRAIALSDAYYGDPSSLTRLYQEMGKPVMVQDADVLE